MIQSFLFFYWSEKEYIILFKHSDKNFEEILSNVIFFWTKNWYFIHSIVQSAQNKACEEAVIIKNDSNTLEKSPFWYMNFKPQYNPEKSRNQLTDSPKKLVKIHRENSADSRIKPYLTEFCDLKMIPAPL